MNRIGNLIVNENIKLYGRVSTWIMMVVGILLFILFTIGIEPWSEYNKNDFMQLIIQLKNLIMIFAITIAGSIVASEHSEGTIKLLLIRARSRWKILLSKWVTLQLFAILQLLIIGVLGFLIAIFSGITEYSIEIMSGRSYSIPVLLTIAYYEILVFSTLSFMLATLFRIQSVAFGITVFIYFVGSILSLGLLDEKWFKFTIFANTNLVSSYMYRGVDQFFGPVHVAFSNSTLILLTHLIVFLIASFWVFEKRDITA